MIRKAGKLLTHVSIALRSCILNSAPRLFRLFEINPTSCNIMITNRCNLRCVMCAQWRERPGEELSAADWKKIIRDLRNNGFRNIHFTGGEPLVRDDLKELVSYCRDNGFTVGMTTNGMLLNADIIKGLIGSGLRSVAVSVDALGENYEKIRGVPGSFRRLNDAVCALAEEKSSGRIDAYINFTLIKDNISLFEDVKGFADSFGLPVAVCLLDKASSIFKLRENEERFWIKEPGDLERLAELLRQMKKIVARRPGSVILDNPGLDYIAGYFVDPRQERIPCVISQDRIYLDPYGNVFGGCLCMGTFGNLKDIMFGQLKRTDRYMNAKRNMFYKRCPGCSCGYMFNIRHTPRLILKNIALNIHSALERMARCRKKTASG